MYGLLSRYSSRREDSVCSQVCVMCVYAWGGAPTCPCACFYRQRVATAALPLSSLISNQLSRLKPKVVYGRRRFLLSFSFSLFYSFSPVLSSSPAILLHYFILFFHPSHSPRSFSPTTSSVSLLLPPNQTLSTSHPVSFIS